MALWPFSSRARRDAEQLLDAVTAASRQPALFGGDRAPDTLQGRFEVVTLHAALALLRLRAEPALEPLAQEFVDQLFRHFDAGLREDGVGDLAVPRRIRKFAGAFYGRAGAYTEAIQAEDAAALAAAFVRNVPLQDGPFAQALAAYALDTARQQAEAPFQALFEAGGWRMAPS